MKVTIIDTCTDKVVGTIRLNLGGLNYSPSEDEVVAEAWRCAIEDGLVRNSDKPNYRFIISE